MASAPTLTRVRRARGFTLIELMVSLTAGLLISAAAFLMARSATTFFQHESAITSAQYAAMVGMARLQADLKNASFLSTPNVEIDQLLCGDPALLPVGGAGRPGARDLAGVILHPDQSFSDASATLQALWAANGLAPDAVTIGGSFDTTEQFAAARIVATGGGSYDVLINFVNDGGAIRTAERAAQGSASFADIFREGRLLRVRDKEGHFSLGVITALNLGNMPTDFTVTISDAPGPVVRDAGNNCGCSGWCTGAPVNVIARMHYDLRSVAGYAAYANLGAGTGNAAAGPYHRGPALPGLANRTELIRVELNEAGQEIPDTLQVLAEFAVDLEFGAAYETATPPGAIPVVRREPVGDTTNVNRYASIGGPPSTGNFPDLIRVLQVRLSTRAPQRDRDVGIAPTADLHPFRFNLGANEGFARMRTLIADVQLPNQATRLP